MSQDIFTARATPLYARRDKFPNADATFEFAAHELRLAQASASPGTRSSASP